MLNTEAMVKANVAYGTYVKETKKFHVHIKGKQVMALDVGKISLVQRMLLHINNLGIGRLIYQLPIPLCKMLLMKFLMASHRMNSMMKH